ncbi:MAG: hypothetical protein RLO01_13520 [Thalassobaculaceae bacterium]
MQRAAVTLDDELSIRVGEVVTEGARHADGRPVLRRLTAPFLVGPDNPFIEIALVDAEFEQGFGALQGRAGGDEVVELIGARLQAIEQPLNLLQRQNLRLRSRPRDVWHEWLGAQPALLPGMVQCCPGHRQLPRDRGRRDTSGLAQLDVPLDRRTRSAVYEVGHAIVAVQIAEPLDRCVGSFGAGKPDCVLFPVLAEHQADGNRRRIGIDQTRP